MKKINAITLLITLLAFAISVNGQITNPLNKLKDKATDRANNKVDKGLDKGLDKTEESLKKKDKNKTDKTDADTTTTTGTTETTTSGTTTAATTTTPTTPTLAAYSKFDFIPGSDVLYYEDYSVTSVGDFPAGWNTDGSCEVMTTNLYTGKWLKLTSGNTSVWNDVPLTLTENYTVEFDVVPQTTDGSSNFTFAMMGLPDKTEYDNSYYRGKAGFSVKFQYYTYFDSYFADERPHVSGMKENMTMKADQKYHVSVWIQKSRIRIYQDQTKIFDLPKAIDVTEKFNKIMFNDGGPLVSNIRVAVGAPDMRSKLITEGKLVSYGIYFDSGKDVVKGESYGSLKEIAAVLTENPTVNIKIVGHTDSDGDDATNLALSKKRAIAAKAALNKDFAIDNSRMETDGLGESVPVSVNTTAEGKAKNRRVEFIKQ